MKIILVPAATALLGLLALSTVACDRASSSTKDAGLASSWKDGGSIARSGDTTILAQYLTDAGYGVPNPQPGSPIAPSREAGIAPPPPAPTVPNVPNAPQSPTPLPITPSAPPAPTNR